MAYIVETTDGLTKWWIVETGSVVNRLSEVMDDQSDGPYLNTADIGAWNATGNPSEWNIACTTIPAGEDQVTPQDVYDTKNTAWLNWNAAGTPLASGEWYWNAGTLTVRLGDDSDPNASDPLCYYAWSNFMTETVEDGVYLIHLNLEIGDGSTSTTLTSINGEFIWFDDGFYPFVTDNATFTQGVKSNSYGTEGSFINIDAGGNIHVTEDGATWNLYASAIHCRDANGSIVFKDATMEARNSVFTAKYRASFTYAVVDFEDVYISCDNNLYLYVEEGTVLDEVRIHGPSTILGRQHNVATNCKLSDVTTIRVTTAPTSLVFRNLTSTIESLTKTIDVAGGSIIEEYSVDIKVVDSEGNALSGATLQITDDQDHIVTHELLATGTGEGWSLAETEILVADSSIYTVDDIIRVGVEWCQVATIPDSTHITVTREIWSSEYPETGHAASTNVYKQANQTSDGSGVFATQYLPYKFWVTTSETEYAPSPYKFTISKAGYETLILDAITVSSKIDWHLELQPYGRTPNP